MKLLLLVFLVLTGLSCFSQDQLFRTVNKRNQKSAVAPTIPVRKTNNYALISNEPADVNKKPTIDSVKPLFGGVGTEITIRGSNFDNTTTVFIGDKKAQSFTVQNNTSITAVIGEGETGDIIVTNAKGRNKVTFPGFEFIKIPVIKNISPTVYSKGSVVTIIGENFHGTAEVTFK